MTAGDSRKFEAALEAFNDLCDLAPDDLERRLEELDNADPVLRAEVEALLRADRRTAHPLDRRAVDLLPELGASSAGSARQPHRIGEYEILGVLGLGGMGVVYEAQQESPRRRVALKLIRPGLLTQDRLRRFEHEASVLASLSHPGIAQIFAAGTAGTPPELQPFIAMELVQGLPLDQFVQERNLDLRARLALVASLCDAVHYAHGKGVVHRDLKPANVLVTADGNLKILDFGVARMTDADVDTWTRGTQVGEVLGTLPYMSPEQVTGDPEAVDLRADIYSIGVLVFELLAGQRPLDLTQRSLAEAARVISEEEPTTLGSIDRSLRGDVETIVGKALEKDRERRYPSAQALASDLRRYLAHEPIQARPPSRTYQLARLARRNRGLVAGLALTMLVLTVGAVTSTALFLRSQHNLGRAQEAEARWRDAAQRAEVETRVAREVSDFLSGLFEVSDPSGAAGARVTALELLERGRQQIAEGLADQPLVRAELMNTMGRVYFNLGQYAAAAPLLDDTIAALRAEPDADPLELATALFSRGEVYHYEGELEPVEAYYAEALALREANLPPGDLLIAHNLDVLGRLYRDLGDPQHMLRARELAQRAQTMRIEGGADAMARSESLQSLGFLAMAEGDLDGARDLIEQALAMREELPSERFRVPELRHTLASLHSARGELAEAEAFYRQGVEESRRIFGERHVFVAHNLSGLAFCLQAQGELERAEATFVEALDLIPNPDSPIGRQVRNGLAFVKQDRGDLDGAEEIYRDLVAASARRLGADHAMTLVHRNNLASLLLDRGDVEGAVEIMSEVVAAHGRAGLETPDRALAVRNLANYLGQLGRQEESVMRFEEYLELCGKIFGEASPQVARAQELLDGQRAAGGR
ncbi:protein kinase domain-containing protein [Engelhardtia mirabilis]|uniref:Serine/threonine-protein kinase PknB n=1 Tax=Engelhardtia mirabilis TaxID=2528011 RepID=A0A518BMH9_9BACT|nr:Serine/threonine-protein kinase PknB [Planctomycetes bacterium Pla133]QDV02501.1 Serine/threonine-protein kinase PknB [Planctomycetes bacterium Pla86]